MKRRRMVATVLLATGLLLSGGLLAGHLRQERVGGPFGHVEVVRASGQPRALVLLLSQGGQHRRAMALAGQLSSAGAVVGMVDVDHYLAHLPADCERPGVDLERLGNRVLRSAANDRYLQPMLVGLGQGASLARVAASHASPGLTATMVVEAGAAPVPAPRCLETAPQGASQQVVQATDAALASTAIAQFGQAASSFRDLPLVELPNAHADRLVILMTGDGGWQSLDKGVATELQRQGAAVVGWNSLRYFWKQKTPAQAAADLSAVIARYQQRWGVQRVELVGYSFGADVMPFLYHQLPQDQQAQVQSLSLLGLSHTAGFSVHIGGWLGLGGGDEQPIEPQLKTIPQGKLLCIYGEQEHDTLCPSLRNEGISVQMTSGGHHFDHDPKHLARLITAHSTPPGPSGADQASGRTISP